MLPWGAALTQDLDLHDLLMASCAQVAQFWDVSINGSPPGSRDFFATTPRGVGCMNFHHPEMQEILLTAAEDAGAEVRRGVTVAGLAPGPNPGVTVQGDGGVAEIGGRLIVGADGRNSRVRGWGGFTPERDPRRLQIAGLLMNGLAAADDAIVLRHDTIGGRACIVFPMRGGRARIYFIRWYDTNEPMLSGDKDVGRFVQECIACGLTKDTFEGATAAGPLAMFEGAETRVAHPHRAGVVLIGDAATSSDPSWGNGLSLALHDVLNLRDHLRTRKDWVAAADAYAADHDNARAALNTVSRWLTELFYEPGAEADERRGRSFEGIATDPTRIPDVLALGPAVPCDEAARRRLFNED